MSVVLGIVGVTAFTNYEVFKEKVDRYVALTCPQIDTIISTVGEGTNAMAQTYATEKGIPFKKLTPDTLTYGDVAKLVINNEITTSCSHVITVWDKKDRTISDLRDKVLARRKNLMTFNYEATPVVKKPTTAAVPETEPQKEKANG